jgi:hypothetical protein
MTGRAALFTAIALAAAAVVHAGDARPAGSAAVRAEPENPPPAHTGGFGEPTCQACHFDADVNDGPGTLQVDGLPERVRPDTTYRIVVRLTQPGMQRAGFMLSIRTSDGAQAGALRSVDDRTAATVAGDVVYIHHALPGTFVEGDAHEWSVEWDTEGLSDGVEVVVNVVANAGNGDVSPFGDLIYASELRLQ